MSAQTAVPVYEEPRHRLVLTHQLVRVMDVRIAPGDTTLFHIHDDFAAEQLSSRVLMQIHDELVIEVAAGEWDAAERIVRARMGDAADLAVPLDVQIGRGQDWNEAAH